MLTGQKGKGLENKGFFDSPYLPSQSPWGLSRVWSQKTDFYPFLRQSWAEMCCPRKPNLQFMLLLGLVAAAVSPHIQKPPQPKWKYPVWRGYTELSLPPDFVSTGMHTLQHLYLASPMQAERLAATSLPCISTPCGVSSKFLTHIPLPKLHNSFPQ